MQKFLAILMDNQTGQINWQYPNELNGNSKQEIFKLLSQDIPAESISEILTEEEYYNKYVKRLQGSNNGEPIKKTIDDISSDQFDNGNDFFNAVMNTAMDEANTTSISNQDNKKGKKQKENKQDIKSIQNNNIPDVKYFEEGGIKFKLENGVLFKKVWKQVLLNGQKMSSGDEAVSEFRLVSASTKKLISVEKVELQRLEWEEVKTH